MPRRRLYKLTNAVERVEKDITAILNKRQSTRYLEGIVLMFSLIENILKWLVFLKIAWDKSERVLPKREIKSLVSFCNQQDFYSAINLAYVIGLIKHPLFRQLDQIRSERNDVVHQLYLFTHRRNRKVLRAKLKKIVRVAEQLFLVLNNLVAETGADDSYGVFIVRKGRMMISVR